MLPGSWAIKSGFLDIKAGIWFSKLEESMACSLFFSNKGVSSLDIFQSQQCVSSEG